MLQIRIVNTAKEERWTLYGRLVTPWVERLKVKWKQEHRTTHGRRCIVDLNDVTFIDKRGERALRVMSNQGAEFIASDLSVRQVLGRLKCMQVEPAASRHRYGETRR
jgi:hypothetical protein